MEQWWRKPCSAMHRCFSNLEELTMKAELSYTVYAGPWHWRRRPTTRTAPIFYSHAPDILVISLEHSLPLFHFSPDQKWHEGKREFGESLCNPLKWLSCSPGFFFFLLSATNVPLMSHLKSHLWYGFSWSSKLQLTEMFPLCSWVILAYSLHLVLGHVFSSDV